MAAEAVTIAVITVAGMIMLVMAEDLTTDAAVIIIMTDAGMMTVTVAGMMTATDAGTMTVVVAVTQALQGIPILPESLKPAVVNAQKNHKVAIA